MVTANSGGGSSPGRSSSGSSSGGTEARRKAQARNAVIASVLGVVAGRRRARCTSTGGARQDDDKANAAAEAPDAAATPGAGPVREAAAGEARADAAEPAMAIDKTAKYTMTLETTSGDISVAHGRGEDPAHGELLQVPRRTRATSTTPSATGSPRRASSCCSAVTRRAPARGGPGYTIPDENLTALGKAGKDGT